jgi:transcriptional regulator with XRE-family HTH domain
MKIKGVRQVDLANYLGISKTAVTQWKSHTSKSYMKYLDELASYFDVTKDELIHTDKSNIYESHLSQEEQELLTNYRLLSNEKKRIITQLIKLTNAL